MAQSPIPTYRTAADVLSRKTGSGIRMVGWTLARTLLIAPPVLLLTPREVHGRVWAGAAASSVLISVFAMMRIFNAKQTGLSGRRTPPRLMARRSMRRLRA